LRNKIKIGLCQSTCGHIHAWIHPEAAGPPYPPISKQAPACTTPDTTPNLRRGITEAEANESPPLDKHGIKRIQQIVGGILYYARAVDITVLAALSTLVSEQTTATRNTNNKVAQLHDYLATHPNATIRYLA
jgi:hypothetical protein